ncbi:TPA: hypothetical protein ACH3X2_012323 [Trebouxia sp. C0005]
MMRMFSSAVNMFHGSSSTETPYSNLHELTARDIDLNNFNFSSLANKLQPKKQRVLPQRSVWFSNQFLSQEPGSNKDIKEFARNKGFKGVLMDKIDVNGPKASPAASGDTSPISWNFAKFLVKKDGTVFGRYGPSSTAVDLTPHIEKLLAEDK